MDKPEWVWFTLHCLDNLGKGFSVTEMVWDFSEGQAMPTFHSREAVDFTLDPESLTRIGKRTLDAKQFEDFEPGKYVCHSGSLISGNPVEGALAFTSSILYLYKNLALQNFGTFIERFGTPFIFAQYLRSEDKDDLIEGLEEIAHAGYGVAPKGTILETIDGARIGGSENLHENAVEMFNRLQSKLVLGQTMTMDDGSSRSQAEVHERVSESINDWDILTVCSTQVQQVFDIWRVLNFGPGGKSGSMDRPQNDEQDLDTLVKVATEMADRGARVPYKRILNIAGFQEPEEDDELLQPRSTGDGDIPGMPRRFERAMQLTPAGAPGGGSNARS